MDYAPSGKELLLSNQLEPRHFLLPFRGVSITEKDPFLRVRAS